MHSTRVCINVYYQNQDFPLKYVRDMYSYYHIKYIPFKF